MSKFKIESTFFLSSILALVLLVLLPFFYIVYKSFSGPLGLTIENYISTFQGVRLEIIINTLKVGIGVSFISILFAVPIAFSISRINIPFKNFIHRMMIISYITPSFLTAIAYVFLFGKNVGMINVLLRSILRLFNINLERGPFDVFNMFSLIFIISLHTIPNVYLLTLASLESMDTTLEESARMAGANKLQMIRKVTLPLLSPSIGRGAVMAFIAGIGNFGVAGIIAVGARFEVITSRIYRFLLGIPDIQKATAISVVLIVLCLLSLLVQRLYIGKIEKKYVTITGKGALRHESIEIGRFKYVLLLFCFLYILFCFILPYLSLLRTSLFIPWGMPLSQSQFTLKHFWYVLEMPFPLSALKNSLLLATMTATIGVLLGAILSWISIRTKFPGRGGIEYVALLTWGLPGIILGLGYMLSWWRFIGGTLLILLIAYIANFITIPVLQINSALAQLDVELEEVARITGASWPKTFLKITLPIIKLALLGSWIMMFIVSLREVGVSLLLYVAGTQTTAVAIFTWFEQGNIGPLSALAIIILLLTLFVYIIAEKLFKISLGKVW